jgi:chemotaxis protein CheD
MHKPENFLEIYLTPGEFHFGDSDTRVRTLLGEGGIFTLWHPRRRFGCISHFRASRRATPSPQFDPAYAEEALALAMVEMARAVTRPREYVANLFVFDGVNSDQLQEEVKDLLDFHNIKVKVEYSGRGNLVFDIWNGEVWMQKKAPTLTKAGKSPEEIFEIYLHPGEWHFGDEDTRIKTLLGSCVSFTLWHPERKIGGMCHYMLPRRSNRAPGGELDGKYGDEAMMLLEQQIEKEGTRPREYVARVFGGGSMLDLGGINVSERNVETARHLIKHHGFRMEGECLGGVGHRNVVFDIWSGEVWLRKGGK